MSAPRWLPKLRALARPVARLDSRTRVGVVARRRSVRLRRHLAKPSARHRRMPLPGAPWSHPRRDRTDAVAVVPLRSEEQAPVPQGPVPRGLLRGARRRLVLKGPRPQSLCLLRARWEAVLEPNSPGAQTVVTLLLGIVVVVLKQNARTPSLKSWRWTTLAAKNSQKMKWS